MHCGKANTFMSRTVQNPRADAALFLSAWLAVVGIFCIELMSIEARCFLPIDASPQVLATGYRLQVLWIDTEADSASVIEVHSFGDRANQKFVDYAMGALAFSIDTGGSITSIANSFHPEPAPGIRLRQNLAQHSIKQRGELLCKHNRNYTTVAQQEQA